MSYLVLIRHGQSEYNAKGLWTGWEDPPLTEEGREEVKKAAKEITDIPFHVGFSSPFIRHKETLEIVKQVLGNDFMIIENDALKERNYGDFTGKNKWKVKEEVGGEEFLKIRRGWDYPIPNGESLRQVYDRVIGYYKSAILPELQKNKNVIISSSGNALRSLVKFLENISDGDIANLDIAPGEAYVYEFIIGNGELRIVNKEVRNAHPNTF